MKISKNTLYKLIQAAFWMNYCSCYGFVSYYLVAKGFGTSIVGIVTAVAGIASAVGQPLIGALADNPKIGWKKPLTITLIVMLTTAIGFCSVSYLIDGAVICIFYGALMLLLGIAAPLVNTIGVAFGKEINFGSARGIGSLGYGAISYVLGILTARMGSMVIPISIAIISVLMLLVTLPMPNAFVQRKPVKEEVARKGNFLIKYPKFTFLWIVCLFMLTVHNLFNAYLLQVLEKVGGNSENLGIAVAIAAVMEVPLIFWYEKVNRKISAQNLLVIAVITYMARALVQLFAPNIITIYLAQALQLTSWGVYAGASVYYADEIIPEADRSKGQAFMTNAITIGSVIGSLVGGALIERYNVDAMMYYQCGTALIAMIGMIVWKIIFNDRKEIRINDR